MHYVYVYRVHGRVLAQRRLLGQPQVGALDLLRGRAAGHPQQNVGVLGKQRRLAKSNFMNPCARHGTDACSVACRHAAMQACGHATVQAFSIDAHMRSVQGSRVSVGPHARMPASTMECKDSSARIHTHQRDVNACVQQASGVRARRGSARAMLHGRARGRGATQRARARAMRRAPGCRPLRVRGGNGSNGNRSTVVAIFIKPMLILMVITIIQTTGSNAKSSQCNHRNNHTNHNNHNKDDYHNNHHYHNNNDIIITIIIIMNIIIINTIIIVIICDGGYTNGVRRGGRGAAANPLRQLLARPGYGTGARF